jgi:hypothetical protein
LDERNDSGVHDAFTAFNGRASVRDVDETEIEKLEDAWTKAVLLHSPFGRARTWQKMSGEAPQPNFGQIHLNA